MRVIVVGTDRDEVPPGITHGLQVQNGRVVVQGKVVDQDALKRILEKARAENPETTGAPSKDLATPVASKTRRLTVREPRRPWPGW